jgi:hypothetical protein
MVRGFIAHGMTRRDFTAMHLYAAASERCPANGTIEVPAAANPRRDNAAADMVAAR